MSDQTTTRRDFARQAGAAAAIGWTIVKPGSVSGTPANSAVKLGVIGPGRRGQAITRHFLKDANVQVTALCDIYDDMLEQAKAKIPAPQANTYKTPQALLDSGVDAVYIATPPYLHPEHFELAVNAKKHIFLEKPVAVDPAGVRRFLAAARRAGPDLMILVDYQQRFGVDYKKAHQIVQSGEIGAVKMIRASWIGGDLPRRSGHPESEEKVRNWLFYKELGGDIIVEQNCHNFDVVNWFVGKHPVSAMGYGGRQVRTDIGNIMDNLGLTFRFDDGRVFSYSATQFAKGGYGHVAETFIGEKGAIETSRRGYTLWNGGQEPVRATTSYDITMDGVKLFLAGVRGEAPKENMAFAAAESTLTAILGRVAIETGKEAKWEEVIRM
jgi:predicted dehydrogenase